MIAKPSLYETITAKIIATVEANCGRPKMPWHRNAGAPLYMPTNAATKNAYRGVNAIALWVTAEEHGYTQPIFATYRQWAALGCQVRKGEKAALVHFYKEIEVDTDPYDANDDGKRRMARASFVFNCAQVDGYDMPGAPADLGPVQCTAEFDTYVAATGVRILHGGDRAFYQPSSDTITMPDEGRFCGTDTMTREEGYMTVLAHELTHYADVRIMPRWHAKMLGHRCFQAPCPASSAVIHSLNCSGAPLVR